MGDEVAAEGPRRRTMRDIATQAGVSVSTVSKVLHGRSDVAAGTRGRVRRLLNEAGYTLPGGRGGGGSVEFAINELNSPWAGELLRGAEAVLDDAGIAMVVSATHNRPDLTERWLDALAVRGSAGAILGASELTAVQEAGLARLGIPYVIVQPAVDAGPDVPTVGSTSWPGGYAATRHLIDLGHRRIAMITGPIGRLSSRARLDGYRTALAEVGVEFDDALVRHGDYSHPPAHRAALELLDLPDRPTAIFAGNDQQALATYRAAAEHGVRVPDELSVVGFDDLPFAEWVVPALTTVRQPLEEMAATAARMLLRLIGGQHLDTPRLELATTLIVRESTAPPSAL